MTRPNSKFGISDEPFLFGQSEIILRGKSVLIGGPTMPYSSLDDVSTVDNEKRDHDIS